MGKEREKRGVGWKRGELACEGWGERGALGEERESGGEAEMGVLGGKEEWGEGREACIVRIGEKGES